MRDMDNSGQGPGVVKPLANKPAWLDPLLAASADTSASHAAADHSHAGGHEGCHACHEGSCKMHCAHDSTVGTVSLSVSSALDLDALSHWLDVLLWERNAGSPDVLRLKGVLNVAGSDKMHMLQAVYELYDVVEGPAWQPGMNRDSRLVVIGRRLDQQQLQQQLMQVAEASSNN